ncbi:hypothetical protein MD484_g7897, partial [Candolleomyces efflorescens]
MPEVDRPDNIILIGTTPRTSFKKDKDGDYDLSRYDFCSSSTTEPASDGSQFKVEESQPSPLDRRDLLERISIIVLNSYTMDENGKELDDLNFPVLVDASNDMIGKVAKLVKGVKLGTLETTEKFDSMLASLKANTRWPTSALAKLILHIHSLVDGSNLLLPDTTAAIQHAFEVWAFPFVRRIDGFLNDFCSTTHDGSPVPVNLLKKARYLLLCVAKREDLVDVIGSLGRFAIELGSLATGAEELITEMRSERSGLDTNSQVSKEAQSFPPRESGDSMTPPPSFPTPARSPNPPAQRPKAPSAFGAQPPLAEEISHPLSPNRTPPPPLRRTPSNQYKAVSFNTGQNLDDESTCNISSQPPLVNSALASGGHGWSTSNATAFPSSSAFSLSRPPTAGFPSALSNPLSGNASHVAAPSLGGNAAQPLGGAPPAFSISQSPPVVGSLFPPDGQQSARSSNTISFTRTISSPPTGIDQANDPLGHEPKYIAIGNSSTDFFRFWNIKGKGPISNPSELTSPTTKIPVVGDIMWYSDIDRRGPLEQTTSVFLYLGPGKAWVNISDSYWVLPAGPTPPNILLHPQSLPESRCLTWRNVSEKEPTWIKTQNYAKKLKTLKDELKKAMKGKGPARKSISADDDDLDVDMQ